MAFADSRARPFPTVTEIADVILRSAEGRVETLFIAKGAKVRGSLSLRERSVRLETIESTDNEDLLDVAALNTFTKRGKVYFLDESEMPAEGAPAVALLRY